MLEYNMKDMAERYHKELVIAEVSMGFTMEDYAAFEKLAPSERKGMATRQELVDRIEFPMTKEGQRDFMKELFRRLKQVPEHLARGFFYWEPAWIPVPGNSWEEQSKLWEQFGSGWASSYAGGYDPQDAGAWFGGCAWENQALFEVDGTPAWTLSLPNILRGE
mgnify:CR=1 FL=1